MSEVQERSHVVRPARRDNLPRSMDAYEDINGLEIDGYKIRFTKKVRLLPVDLVPTRLVNSENNESE